MRTGVVFDYIYISLCLSLNSNGVVILFLKFMVEMYAHGLVVLYIGLLLWRLYCQYKAVKMTNDKDLIGKIKPPPLYIIRVGGGVSVEIRRMIRIMNIPAVLMIVIFIVLAAMTLLM